MSGLVILARKLDAGGAERQLVVLAKALADRGREVHVVLFYRGGVFDQELLDSRVQVHYLDKGHRWDIPAFLWRAVVALRRIAPDVVYAFLDVPNILAALLRPWVRWPRLIWSIRVAHMDMSRYDRVMRMAHHIESRLSAMADLVVSNSDAGADWAAQRGMARNRLVVIRNGIDTERFRPGIEGAGDLRQTWSVPRDARLVGLVGRMDVMKDHPNFLRAAAQVAARDASVYFVCVGSGTPEAQARLQALGRELGLADRLIWAGPRSDMPRVYNALQLLCLSSNAEGFPNVVGEAMACGVPCVVTNVGDAAHVVGDCGAVVPPADHTALGEGLLAMLARLNRELDLGLRARERIQAHFSVRHMVQQTESLLWPSP